MLLTLRLEASDGDGKAENRGFCHQNPDPTFSKSWNQKAENR